MYLWAWGTIIMWACCPSPNRGACETSAPPSNGCNLASLAFHHSMWDCHSQLWTGPIPPHRHVPPVILWWQIQHLRTRMDHGWPWFHHYQPDRAGMRAVYEPWAATLRWLIPRTTPPSPLICISTCIHSSGMNSGLEEGQQSYTPLHMGLPPIQTPSPLSHMHPCALFMPLFSVPGPIPIYHSSPPFTFSNTFLIFCFVYIKKKKKRGEITRALDLLNATNETAQ